MEDCIVVCNIFNHVGEDTPDESVTINHLVEEICGIILVVDSSGYRRTRECAVPTTRIAPSDPVDTSLAEAVVQSAARVQP